MNVAPAKDIKKVQEHINEFRLIEAVKALIIRVDTLEARVQELEGEPKVEKKRGRRFPTQQELILEALSDGKIYAVYGIAEKITESHPDMPQISVKSLFSRCAVMAAEGSIVRVGGGAYRVAIKPTTEE